MTFLLRAQKNSDIVLALFVVAITAMLLVPLPTVLLDFLLAINITFALLLLLVGLYMPNALALLAFPSLLLLTTLFRLGLNVASTRLILSQGDAGRVIQSFGTFLVGGEIVVGVIIFTIITLVNFIVIARGSSRVSEVAARFALDSLPGKQMAIDADLRAGIISPEQAQQRRDDLRKESQLYGSMDGAMKFVQGDAIAGLFIIVTNIVGGMYLGVSGGLSLSEALETYTILTVGDGLVSQIPALLISICAGIVVTRVSSGENTTLGTDVGAQIFARPGALMGAGAMALIIATLPGLPSAPFLLTGFGMIGLGYYMRRQQAASAGTLGREASSTPALPGRSPVALLGFADSKEETELQINLDASVLYKLYRLNIQRYQTWWAQLQSDFYEETGLVLPALRVVADDLTSTGHYSIYVGSSMIESGTVPLDSVLVEMNPENAVVLGLEVGSPAEHPLSGNAVYWALQSPVLRRVVESGKIRTFDFFEFVGMKICAFYQRYPEEILTLTEVHAQLKALEKKHPGLLANALNHHFISPSRLTEVLQQLAREGISVRDFRQVIEAVVAYCAANNISFQDDTSFDTSEAVAAVRMSRRRQILARLASGRGVLKVFTLSPEVEESLEGASLLGGAMGLAPGNFDAMRVGLTRVIEPVLARGLYPAAILCRSELRRKVLEFCRSCNRTVGVITFDELDPKLNVEPVAVWKAASSGT